MDPSAESTDSSINKKQSKENWRKQKELEEARKAGTVPAEVDEEGKDINPHIPQYIKQSPWYISNSGPTLKHQRPQPEKHKVNDTLNDWYIREPKQGVCYKGKFRKGACENCGAVTHRKQDCMSRPRKVSAKLNNRNIAPDEAIQRDLSFNYEAKRDRWNGFNPKDYEKVIKKYSLIEEAKESMKADRLVSELSTNVPLDEIELTPNEKQQGLEPSRQDNGSEDSDRGSDDEEKYAEKIDVPGQKFDSKLRTTVRNLRIREDTAKYLLNLDPNSAFYDPKSRSMRENPFKESNLSSHEVPFAGENFVRSSTDTSAMACSQLFAWDVYNKGIDVHLQGEPTKLELLYKQVNDRKKEFQIINRKDILGEYGGEEHFIKPDDELLTYSSEKFVQFTGTGKRIGDKSSGIVRSRYQEDVFLKDHTSVWGSYWEKGCWGYSCCKSLIKTSDCHSASSKLVNNTHDVHKGKELLRYLTAKSHKPHTQSISNKDADIIHEERVNTALENIQKEQAEMEKILRLDERKRPYHSSIRHSNNIPIEIEMEAHQRLKRTKEDPMFQTFTDTNSQPVPRH